MGDAPFIWLTLFSHDGIHPSRTGHALLANEAVVRILDAFDNKGIGSLTFGGRKKNDWRRFSAAEFQAIFGADPMVR